MQILSPRTCSKNILVENRAITRTTRTLSFVLSYEIIDGYEQRFVRVHRSDLNINCLFLSYILYRFQKLPIILLHNTFSHLVASLQSLDLINTRNPHHNHVYQQWNQRSQSRGCWTERVGTSPAPLHSLRREKETYC